MKIEDAIENMNDVLTVMKTQHMMKSIDGELEDGEVQMYRDRYESVHQGISALEKQMPKEAKPYRGSNSGLCKCPACKTMLCTCTPDENLNYCPSCGQALKW